jgi:hypothetical protein
MRRGRILFVDLLAGRGVLKPARGPRRRLIFFPTGLWDLAFDPTLRGRQVTFTRIGTTAIRIRAYPRRGINGSRNGHTS